MAEKDPQIVGLVIVEKSALENFDPLAAEGITLGMQARDQRVTNDEELAAANTVKKSINAYSKTVKDMRLAITRPIDAVVKSLINRERELLEPVEEGKKFLGDNILAYEEERERIREIERQRIEGLVERVESLYKAGMTRNQVDAGKTAAKALIGELGADGDIPAVKLALINLSNAFAERVRDLDIEDARAKKQKLESDQAKIDEEKRQMAAREAEQAAQKAQIEADKAAAKVERERPKSNIIETVEVTVDTPDIVDRKFCSPDVSKVKAYLKDHPDVNFVAGFIITRSKKVR